MEAQYDFCSGVPPLLYTQLLVNSKSFMKKKVVGLSETLALVHIIDYIRTFLEFLSIMLRLELQVGVIVL